MSAEDTHVPTLHKSPRPFITNINFSLEHLHIGFLLADVCWLCGVQEAVLFWAVEWLGVAGLYQISAWTHASI